MEVSESSGQLAKSLSTWLEGRQFVIGIFEVVTIFRATFDKMRRADLQRSFLSRYTLDL